MPYAGLPEDADVSNIPEGGYAGLPQDAIIDVADGPIIDVTADAPDLTTAEKLNNPYFGINTPEKLRAEMDLSRFVPSRKQVADFTRPILEGGGTVAGGVAGSTFAPVAGTLAGAGLGYATGKKLADFIEGAPPPETLTDAAIETGKDVLTGAAMEAGGQGLAAFAGKGLTQLAKAKNAMSRATPAVTEQGLKEKAGQILADNTGTAPIYAQNAEEAAKLNIPGYKPSLGEARNDPGLIKLQRGIERMDGTAANTIVEAKAANQAAVKDYLANEFKGNESIDDVINALNQRKAQIGAATGQAESQAATAKAVLNPADNQTVGRGITDELDAAVQPLKEAEREAWGKVPNYPIPTKHFDEAADQLKSTPLEADTEAAVNKIIDYAHRMPKTTEGLQSVERTINDKMFAPNADPNVRRVLGTLKQAVAEDFRVMGEAADAGDIATHGGKVIFPSKMQAERETLTARIARDSAAAESAPDIPSIVKALRDAGDPPNQWMKQIAETQKAYQERLLSRYNTVIGKEIPSLSAEPPASVVSAQERITQIDDVLANTQPAADVAAAYRAAKDVSKERFDRFGRGAISEITQRGNQASGNRLPDALIPAKVFTPDGADDFIRAVGKEQAAFHADQYAAQDLLSKANPLTGEIPAKTVAAWIQKNMGVLRKYGISGKYTTVAKAQAQAEIARAAEVEFNHSVAAKLLGADPDKAIAAAMQGNSGMHGGGISSKNTAGIIDDLLDKMKGNPQGVKGLQNAFKDFLIDKVETTAKTISGDAIISPAAIQKELVKYAPAMRRLYASDPQKITALTRVSKAVEIQSRSAKSPIGGGSDTAENVNMSRALLGKVVDLVPGGNLVTRLSRLGLSKLGEMNAAELNKVIARALYDPEFAQTLYMAAKRYKPEVVQKRVNSHIVTLGLYAAKPSDRPAVDEDSDPLGIR